MAAKLPIPLPVAVSPRMPRTRVYRPGPKTRPARPVKPATMVGKAKKKKRGAFQDVLSSMRTMPGAESRMRRFG